MIGKYLVQSTLGRSMKLIHDGDDGVLIVGGEEAETVGTEEVVVDSEIRKLSPESILVILANVLSLEDHNLVSLDYKSHPQTDHRCDEGEVPHRRQLSSQ